LFFIGSRAVCVCLCGGRSVFSILTCKKTREKWKNGDIPNVDVKDVPLFESFLLSSSSVCYFSSLLFCLMNSTRFFAKISPLNNFLNLYILFNFFYFYDSETLVVVVVVVHLYLPPWRSVRYSLQRSILPLSPIYTHTGSDIFLFRIIMCREPGLRRRRRKKKLNFLFFCFLWKLALGEYKKKGKKFNALAHIIQCCYCAGETLAFHLSGNSSRVGKPKKIKKTFDFFFVLFLWDFFFFFSGWIGRLLLMQQPRKSFVLL
jgi:hypothetical protein